MFLPRSTNNRTIAALLALSVVMAACEVIPALLALHWAEGRFGLGTTLPSFTAGAALLALLGARWIAGQSFALLSWRSVRDYVRARQHALLRRFARAPWRATSASDQGAVRLMLTTQAEEERALLTRIAEAAARGLLFVVYISGFLLSGRFALACFLLAASGAGVVAALLYRRATVGEHTGQLVQAFRRFMARAESVLQSDRIIGLGPSPSPLELRAAAALKAVDHEEWLLRRAMLRAHAFRYGLFVGGAALATALLMQYATTVVAAIAALIAARALMVAAGAVSGLGSQLPRWRRLAAQRMKLIDQLGGGPLAQPADARPAPPQPLQRLHLSEVAYSYEAAGESRPVLRGISLQLERGQIISIEGDSGAGKSTLADLLAGLLVPQSGTVSSDAQTFNAATGPLRAAAMIVPPASTFVDGGIRTNVGLFAPEAGEEEVTQVLRAVAADFALESQGSQSRVRNVEPEQLSHGQRQRLAIARALLAQPRLLILDEALSGLDVMAQRRVLDHLYATRGERMTVIITHDSRNIPDTVLDASYRLVEGRLHDTVVPQVPGLRAAIPQ